MTRPIQRDMLIYNIMPHSHLRGRAGTMTAIHPDDKLSKSAALDD